MPAQLRQACCSFQVCFCCIIRQIQFNFHIPTKIFLWFRKIWTHSYTISFILIQLLNDVQSISFSPDYFFSTKFFLASLLQLFFVKIFDNFFTMRPLITYGHSIFTTFITKSSADQFSVQPFTKILLFFDILT